MTRTRFSRPFGTRATINSNPAVNCRAILKSPSGRSSGSSATVNANQAANCQGIRNSYRDFGSRLTAAVPEGSTTIAQRFNAGFTSPPIRVPKGRLKCEWEWSFNRPFGTWTVVNVFPALKRRAILTVSLRDKHRLEFPNTRSNSRKAFELFSNLHRGEAKGE
jgi:hypothetical protein